MNETDYFRLMRNFIWSWRTVFCS